MSKCIRSEKVDYPCGHYVEGWVLRENCPVCDAIVADSLCSKIECLEAALQKIASVEHVDVDGLWEEFPALTREEMFHTARSALGPKP